MVKIAFGQGSSEPLQDNLHWEIIFKTATAVVVLVLILSAVKGAFGPDQFIYQAQNFARGHLSVDDMPLIYPDYVIRNGHTYLPIGPLPALVLVPFLPLLEVGLNAIWISNLFTLVNVLLLYRILRFTGVSHPYDRWAILLFFGGTCYLAVTVTMVSWYFAHVLGLTCLLAAMGEALGKRRIILVGILLGLAVMARSTMLCSLPFFLWLLWKTYPGSYKGTIFLKQCARLVLGLSVPIVALLAYNYLRFESVFETGYGIDVVGSEALFQAREYGLFSLAHIPKNLFAMLVQGPLPFPGIDAPVLQYPYVQPSPWGMGVFYTSPALLLIFRAIYRDPIAQACCLGIGATLIPLLTYYGTGWVQFGYRYSLDFMPFLILLAVRGFARSNTNLMRVLIVLSVLINLWGVFWLQQWL